MRSIERAAIESGVTSGLDLMERAGQGVVDAIFNTWPKLGQTAHKAVILCGPGNNGGDGFVIARLLHRWGWQSDVYLLGDPGKLPPDARTNYDRWRRLGAVMPIQAFPQTPPAADLFVDALFGTGLARPLEGAALRILQALGVSGRSRLVAVDIPSGLCADSGKVLGGRDMGPASLTVTFHRPKLGHYLENGPRHCGVLINTDIGLSGAWQGSKDADTHGLVDLVKAPGATDVARLLKTGAADGSHKFTYGHALVLSGGYGRTGAARLSARAALRVGAGLVTLGVPPAAAPEVASQITSVMMREVPDSQALSTLLADERLKAVCIGPGLGLAQAQARLVAEVLQAGRATVLDADALTLLAQTPSLFTKLHDRCVLTPHHGEFARLFPDIADLLTAPSAKGPAYSKVLAARVAAKRAGCVVLFKGADTVIASPDGQCALHAAAYDRAAPWLATAGSGDVLAGLITGLLARGFSPVDAARTGAWLHTEAARSFGPGLIAEDLPEQLPMVFRKLMDTEVAGDFPLASAEGVC